MQRYEYRTGFGFDVHAFEEGDHVILGGIKLPHDKGLKGHSDADVVLHALTDALLGAIGEGDIGQHFPPTDDAFKDMDSGRFIKGAVEMIAHKKARIVNVDITAIGEAPKVNPYRDKMRDNIAKLLGLDRSRVNVKATTTEKLGFTGRQEGLAAQAVATLEISVEGSFGDKK